MAAKRQEEKKRVEEKEDNGCAKKEDAKDPDPAISKRGVKPASEEPGEPSSLWPEKLCRALSQALGSFVPFYLSLDFSMALLIRLCSLFFLSSQGSGSQGCLKAR